MSYARADSSAHSSAHSAAEETSCLDFFCECFANCCSPRQVKVEIEGDVFQLRKQIAEGGFSYVFLADCNAYKGEYFAVKKMIIQTNEQLRSAQWEIEVMQELTLAGTETDASGAVSVTGETKSKKKSHSKDRRYRNYSYLLPLLKHTVARHSKIPEFKIVYMVVPYCPKDNLVAVLTEMRQAGIVYMDEWQILKTFQKICFAVYCLHSHDPCWVHRDIKLDNILISNSNDPYLMDFGSVTEARFSVNSRAEAMRVMENSQRSMTAAYTPPEFFDCPSKMSFDERTDVWALGCLLYAMAFGSSPFHCDEMSASPALAVLGASITFPAGHPFSDQFCGLISWMCAPKLKHRPFVPAIIDRVSDVLTDLDSSSK